MQKTNINLNALKTRLINTLEVESMGDTKIYNYLMNHLDHNHNLVKSFMVNHLGYDAWMVNKIRWHKQYCKNRYQQQKLNTSQ